MTLLSQSISQRGILFLKTAPLGTHFTFLASSNSMYPTIHVNDLVTIKKISPIKVKVHAIGAFVGKNKSTILIHRIIQLHSGTNKYRIFKTKGDNNLRADSEPFTEEGFLGLVIRTKRQNQSAALCGSQQKPFFKALFNELLHVFSH